VARTASRSLVIAALLVLAATACKHVPWHHDIETLDEEIAVADRKPDVGALPSKDKAGDDGERVL
jgi:hypothetical protein